MMKQFSYVGRALFIALTIVVMTSMVVSASPLAGSTTKNLSTNFTLVNLGTNDATVIVEYKKEAAQNGDPWASSQTNLTVPRNFGQLVVAQYAANETLTAGKGSAIISSSSSLGSVVQIMARGYPAATAGAYSGITTPSSKYYAPLVQARKATASGVSNAQVMIQNVESSVQAVTVQFIPSKNPDGSLNGNAYTTPAISIPAGSTYYYDLADETKLANNWTGSAVINAATGMKVAVIVNLFAGANTLTTYNAFPVESIGKVWAIPQFVSRLASNNLNVPLSIQNLSGGTLPVGAVTVHCVSATTAFDMSNVTAIDDNQGYAFNPVADTTIPGDFSGACTLTSTGDVVVIATLRRPGRSDDAAAYEAFNVAQSTGTKVVFPLMSKRLDNGFATVGAIMNLGGADANVTLTYTPSASYAGSQTPITFNATIVKGGNLYQNFRTLEVTQVPEKWFGSLVVQSTNGQPLAGYVQLTNYKGLAGDSTMAHDAFTLP